MPKLLLLAAAAILSVFLARSYLYSTLISLRYRNEPAKIAVSPTVTPVPSTPTPVATPEPQYNGYEIVRTDAGKETIVYKDHVYNSLLAKRWGNELFTFNSSNDKEVHGSIQMHNILTGVNTNIRPSDLGEYFDIDDMYVANDTLFFSYGGYLSEGYVYYVDLTKPVSQRVPKLLNTSGAKLHNPHFTEMNGKEYIHGGEGDACWGFSEYNSFDPFNKVSQYIGKIESGCEEGEDLISVQKGRDQMLIGTYKSFPDEGEDFFGYGAKRTTSIIRRTLKPGAFDKAEILVSQEDMPKHISRVLYNDEKSTLTLLGPTVYEFDLADKRLRELGTLDEHYLSNDFGSFQRKNSVVFSNFGSEGNSDTLVIFDLDQKKQRTVPASTYPEFVKESDTDKVSGYDVSELKKEITALKLPSNYSVKWGIQ